MKGDRPCAVTVAEVWVWHWTVDVWLFPDSVVGGPAAVTTGMLFRFAAADVCRIEG